MDCLSTKIREATGDGHFKGVYICRDISVKHNLFVDDVLVFGMLDRDEWAHFHYIPDQFGSATGLRANEGKSIIFFFKW